MMLLPQGKAFNALKLRLKNIKIFNEHDSDQSKIFEKKLFYCDQLKKNYNLVL